jgi:hypothetical protein
MIGQTANFFQQKKICQSAILGIKSIKPSSKIYSSLKTGLFNNINPNFFIGVNGTSVLRICGFFKKLSYQIDLREVSLLYTPWDLLYRNFINTGDCKI